jgi:hypothetical protein
LQPSNVHNDVYRDFKIEISELRSGEQHMHRAHLCITALFLAAAFAASGSTVVAAIPNDEHDQVRIYDSWHHDYHDWNDHEDRAYRAYQHERHEAYVLYERQKHKYQHHYWNWSHSHPDHDQPKGS